MTARTVLIFARLTLREAARRRVLRALAAMTLLLLALSLWGFSRINAEFGGLTTGEARIAASTVLNLVMFGFSLIAALGTAFLVGPTVAGEIESGQALAMLARPVGRAGVLAGKWLGLAVFGGGYVAAAGLAQIVVVQVTVGYWPPNPAGGLALLAAQTTVLMTLAMLLSTVVSPMASGVVAVGVFGATWIAGVVGGVGESLGSEAVARIGTVSRMILPTDGLWQGAMHAFQDQTVFQFNPGIAESPFSGDSPLSMAYIAWVAIWVLMVLGLTATVYQRRDI